MPVPRTETPKVKGTQNGVALCYTHWKSADEDFYGRNKSRSTFRTYPRSACTVDAACRQVGLAADRGAGDRDRRPARGAPGPKTGRYPNGSAWAVGTETRLVRRLQQEYPEQTIVPLSERPPYCPTMGMITLRKLAEMLVNIH